MDIHGWLGEADVMPNRVARKLTRAMTCLTASITVALLLTPASAGANEPWAVTPVMPANGATFSPSSPTPDGRVGAVGGEMTSPVRLPAGTQTRVEITAENVPGQDGTLADDKVVSLGVLYARDSDPLQWTGSISAGAFLRPGTYYLQFSASVLDSYNDDVTYCSNVTPGSVGLCLYVSPVFTFTIAAPPAATPTPTPNAGTPERDATPNLRLSRAQAASGVKRWVARRYHGKRLTATRSRMEAARFNCRVRYVRAGARREIFVEARRTESGLRYRRS
jgi:hypothetical protein